MKQQRRGRIVMRCITLWIMVTSVAVLAWPSCSGAETPRRRAAPEIAWIDPSGGPAATVINGTGVTATSIRGSSRWAPVAGPETGAR